MALAAVSNAPSWNRSWLEEAGAYQMDPRGSGLVVTFSHGWPLNADAWDSQMLYPGKRGFRVIAHDRRGRGRSGQTWGGNDLDTYADDLAELFDKLNLKDVTMIGHSTGVSEVVRYIGRHGTKRVKKAVLIGAIPPVMLKSEKNPGGLPISVFEYGASH